MLLSSEKTKKLLAKYKIPLIKSQIVKNKNEAFDFAKKNGYPVVLKISSQNILHKTDIGGVILDIQDKKSLVLGFDKINKLAKSRKANILIQKQEKGIEVIIGAKIDPVFGPIIMFGLGGIFVEVFKDVSFRLAPITKNEATKMIKEIKGYKLLTGFRGQKPVNIDKIKDILVNASKMISKEKQIKEFDFNPIIANEKNARVADAKIILKSKSKNQNAK